MSSFNCSGSNLKLIRWYLVTPCFLMRHGVLWLVAFILFPVVHGEFFMNPIHIIIPIFSLRMRRQYS
jgi:hypothetical protein